VSQKTHPRLVGAFVLGGVALVVAAIVLLSSGNWFEPRVRFTVFFPGSVRGLGQGAPVSFRGVRIGEVKDVKAFTTGRASSSPIQIEVVIEVRTHVVEAPEGMERPFAAAGADELARELIARGVRARMLSQSLLTGQKFIELDFLPDEPARVSGLKRRYPELPTTPTAMELLGDRAEVFLASLAEMPLDKLVEDLRKTLQSVNRVLSSPELDGAVAGAHRATRELGPAIVEARAAIAEARDLIQDIDARVGSLGAASESTLSTMRETLEQAQRTLDAVDQTFSGTDAMRIRATHTLEELERSLQSIRHLVDYLQAHPEALLQGKAKPEEKK
jgi:paraquat-inducible protein B